MTDGINEVSRLIGTLQAGQDDIHRRIGDLIGVVNGYRSDLNGKLAKHDVRLDTLEAARDVAAGERKGMTWMVHGLWAVGGALAAGAVAFKNHFGINAIVLALLMGPALAAPPPGADPNSPVAKWLHSKTNDHGTPCCSLADCRPAHVRGDEVNGYEARHEGKPWLPVPPHAIRPDNDNPTAQTWACINYEYNVVYCVLWGGAT